LYALISYGFNTEISIFLRSGYGGLSSFSAYITLFTAFFNLLNILLLADYLIYLLII